MWKGPLEDGVTQSLINKFLEDPFAFYLYAILGLEEDVPVNENLIWGDCYHKGLEILLDTKDKAAAVAAVHEHLKKYPTAPPSFRESIPKMLTLFSLTGPYKADWRTELVMDEVVKIRGIPFRLRGKLDGLSENVPDIGGCLAEHKCKGYTDPAQTRDEIVQDLQCNFYMRMHEVEWVAYDLIKIPEAQKYGPSPSYKDTPAQWVNKIMQGPIGSYGGNYPIFGNRHKWINHGLYLIPEDSQEEYWNTTITPLLLRMLEWYEYVTDSSFDMDDPASYGPLFYRTPVRHFNGRKTEKFKCSYHPYLVGQIDLEDLISVPSYFSELEEDES